MDEEYGAFRLEFSQTDLILWESEFIVDAPEGDHEL